MKIFLAAPRGFCAGVRRAIAAVEDALDRFGAPVFVRHEIVHNRLVCDRLRARGAIFVENLAEVPPGAPVIFSAHGVGAAVEAEARERGLRPLDATCPLVKKVHRSVIAAAERGATVILVGQKNHAEIRGTLGQIPPGAEVFTVEKISDVAGLPAIPGEVFFATQTTLAADETAEILAALRQKFPQIAGPAAGDLCFSTTNRQAAVREIAPRVELFLVFGSKNSSNSAKLRAVAERAGCPRAILLDEVGELDPEILRGVEAVGVTAGASAPESAIEDFLEKFAAKIESVEPVTVTAERVNFPAVKM